MHDDESKAMAAALATYTGPVTRCQPGKARGDLPIKKTAPDLNAAGWQVPPPDESEQRRRRRMARAKRQRIAEHNAAIRQAHGMKAKAR
jgi:hypothetical protein